MKDEGLYRYSANVTSVYDADTCTVDIDLGLGIWLRKQKLRFFGINAPEMRGPERPKGILARDFCRQLIDKKRIIIQTLDDGKGKYGRLLAILWLEYPENEWININELLVERGYAIAKDYQLIKYTIELPRLPSKALSSNARVHWSQKSRAMIEDKDLVIGQVLSKYQRPDKPLTSVKVELLFILDGRRRDWDNLCSSSKGYLDGLVDSGLIEDDNMTVIKELSLKGRRAKKKEALWTLITIIEIKEKEIG